MASRKEFITAMTKCAESIDTKNCTIVLPEGFNEDMYFAKLEEITRETFTGDNPEVTKKRSTARVQAKKHFDDLKTLRSVYNVEQEIDGESHHISEIFQFDTDKDLRELLLGIKQDTITGAELAAMIERHDSDTERKKEKRSEFFRNKEIKENLNKFLNREAYPALKPDELFYASGQTGRGRRSFMSQLANLDM